ncbi:MAG TPA: hypothetical protein VFT87_03590 [Candidatus Saccharimonadales bacterium]|nr:hypothetical protein [Candidatus Saccharimonadales bacterium]
MTEFQQTVWQFYRAHGRRMPWRDTPTPYFVLVSEVMLQQTQVARVAPKFLQFMQLFPDFQTLAKAELGDVLRAWNGLGYNRRAKFLWQAARSIVQMDFPKTADGLAALPGIGRNTAGAIVAYVYNQPVVFVETNIRTVFIHHFFEDQPAVSDAEISKLVQSALPSTDVRQWYWALMDYGSFLKTTTGSKLEKVKQYKKQGRFAGSQRQIRGHVLRLLAQDRLELHQLQAKITDQRLTTVLAALVNEGLVKTKDNSFSI